MQDIFKLVEENRVEAFNLLKANGGEIRLLEETDEQIKDGNWDGCFCGNTTDCVLDSGSNGILADVCVLAVRCSGREGQLEFYCYDLDACEFIGWQDDATFLFNTENRVYEVIGKIFTK